MRIVVYRPAGGLGDVITCLPVIVGLRRKYPDAKIDMLALRYYESIYRRMPMDMFLYTRKRWPHLQGDKRVETLLRVHRVRGAVDKFVDLWCPAGEHETSSRGRVTMGRIESFCAAAGVEPSTPRLPINERERADAREMLAEMKMRRPFVVIQRHSANIYKDWPVESQRELARRLLDDGVGVLTLGLREPLLELPGAVEFLKMGTLQAAALIAEADLLVAPDSGLMHVAGAVGTRCVALFGPTHAEATLRYYPTHTALWAPPRVADLGCHCPCYHMKPNGFRPKGFCDAEGECLRRLRPSEVYFKVMEALAQGVETPGGSRLKRSEATHVRGA